MLTVAVIDRHLFRYRYAFLHGTTEFLLAVNKSAVPAVAQPPAIDILTPGTWG